jgi:hypothetical protein
MNLDHQEKVNRAIIWDKYLDLIVRRSDVRDEGQSANPATCHAYCDPNPTDSISG